MLAAGASPLVFQTDGAVLVGTLNNGHTEVESSVLLQIRGRTVVWNRSCSQMIVYDKDTAELLSLEKDAGMKFAASSRGVPGVSGSILWAKFSPCGTHIAIATMEATSSRAETNHGDSTHIVVRSIDNMREMLRVSIAGGECSDSIFWRDDDLFLAIRQRDTVEFFDLTSAVKIGTVPVNRHAEVSVNIAPAASAVGLAAIVFEACTTDVEAANLRTLTIDNLSRIRIHCTEALHRVDGLDCTWSASGSYVLCIASALVDARGENYGSVGDVYLKRIADLAAPLRKMNTTVIQDAAWSPVHDAFLMIEGKSPSTCSWNRPSGTAWTSTIFHRGYKNTIRWSPLGDMIVIGGFGNLAGDMAFFYQTADQLVHIAENRCACTVKCEWSPCGRFFATASLWPRMRVDNSVMVWSRDGRLLTSVLHDILHDVRWMRLRAEYPPLPRPEIEGGRAPAAAVGPAAFKPKGSTSVSSDLIQSYIAGKVRLEDLPPALQQKLKTYRPPRAAKVKADQRAWRAVAASGEVEGPAPTEKNGSAKSKKAATSNAKLKTDTPAEASHPPAEAPKTPMAAPPAAAGAQPAAAGAQLLREVDRGEAQPESIVSLLQQILPPTSTVHVGQQPERLPAANRLPPVLPEGDLKATVPPAKWYYTDPRGLKHGPFSRKQMRVWWEKGYFPHSLLVRKEDEAAFQPLSYYFPDGRLSFTF